MFYIVASKMILKISILFDHVQCHNVFVYGLAYGGVNSIDSLFDYTRQLSIAEPVAIVERVA